MIMSPRPLVTHVGAIFFNRGEEIEGAYGYSIALCTNELLLVKKLKAVEHKDEM